MVHSKVIYCINSHFNYGDGGSQNENSVKY
jgi:hypothetical protein